MGIGILLLINETLRCSIGYFTIEFNRFTRAVTVLICDISLNDYLFIPAFIIFTKVVNVTNSTAGLFLQVETKMC